MVVFAILSSDGTGGRTGRAGGQHCDESGANRLLSGHACPVGAAGGGPTRADKSELRHQAGGHRGQTRAAAARPTAWRWLGSTGPEQRARSQRNRGSGPHHDHTQIIAAESARPGRQAVAHPGRRVLTARGSGGRARAVRQGPVQRTAKRPDMPKSRVAAHLRASSKLDKLGPFFTQRPSGLAATPGGKLVPCRPDLGGSIFQLKHLRPIILQTVNEQAGKELGLDLAGSLGYRPFIGADPVL
jgi:hypothetical protein